MEFEDFKAEFHAPPIRNVEAEPVMESRDLDAVPERPKKTATPKALQLNKDYDAWSAATPRPIFEKKEA